VNRVLPKLLPSILLLLSCAEPKQFGVLRVNDAGLCNRLMVAYRLQGATDSSNHCGVPPSMPASKAGSAGEQNLR
jgi:hypothetical protein